MDIRKHMMEWAKEKFARDIKGNIKMASYKELAKAIVVEELEGNKLRFSLRPNFVIDKDLLEAGYIRNRQRKSID